jgi:hypothetical protein
MGHTGNGAADVDAVRFEHFDLMAPLQLASIDDILLYVGMSRLRHYPELREMQPSAQQKHSEGLHSPMHRSRPQVIFKLRQDSNPHLSQALAPCLEPTLSPRLSHPRQGSLESVNVPKMAAATSCPA